MEKTMSKVYLRLHNFIYNKCGFLLPIKITPKNNLPDGVITQIYKNLFGINPFNRNKIGNILTGISISNIKGAKAIITHNKIYNKEGYRPIMKEVINGRICGFITLRTGLPVFHIIIKYNNKEMQRMIIPQNPWKINSISGNFTGPALAVQNGDKISWIMNPNKISKGGVAWIAKITNDKIKYFNWK